MKHLIEQNKSHLLWIKVFKNHDNIVKNIVDTLNIDKIIILSWMKNVWKINIIKEMLTRTKLIDNVFYFNKENDTKNEVLDSEKLNILYSVYVWLYNIPKIIILEDVSKIEWIKDFIPKFYKQKIKIVIIWNNLKIKWIKEIEILPENISDEREIDKELKYWLLNDINYFNDINYLNNLKYKNTIYLQERILTLLKNDIILKDIFISFWVKNFNLYNHTLSYLAKTNKFTSLRDLQKKLNLFQNISIKTTIDYIDFSLQAKIIKRVYNYDIKTEKIISSQAKYYFTDLWIRNNLVNFEFNKTILLENYIFNELQRKWYKVHAWKSWNFEFTFIAEKIHHENNEKINKIYIHISKETEKDEIKRERKKLNKIPDDYKKYLIVENLDNFKFKKYEVDNVKIIWVEKFLGGS